MLRSFLSSEGGNFAAIFAVAMVPVMASVAGVVDFASTANKAAKLQNSLDTAALAIATEYYSGMTHDALQDLGETYFASNMLSGMTAEGKDFSLSDETEAFEIAASEEGQLNFISVSSRITHDGFLGGASLWHATRRSYVRIAPGPKSCVLALDEDASAAIKIQGSAQVAFDGCVIASNSDAADAVSRGGTATISADCVSAVGGTEGVATSYSDLDCSKPLENQYPSFNPLANVPLPAYGACASMPGGPTKTLTPGTFCNKTWSGDITLEPGVYILKGGKIQLGGNDSLIGHGVTIFLMEDATFTTNGNEYIELSPPSSGPYAGITVYQAPGNTQTLTINGSAGSTVEGFIYAPSAHVIYAGTSTMSGAGSCIRIIANTIEFNGTSAVASDCEGVLGGREIYASREISLVR
jgi:hypothetical protein